MKLAKDNYYYFKFAGDTLYGKFIGTEILYEGTEVYLFEDKKKYKYPIKKENICGNLKQ
jgi:hypothetical protein